MFVGRWIIIFPTHRSQVMFLLEDHIWKLLIIICILYVSVVGWVVCDVSGDCSAGTFKTKQSTAWPWRWKHHTPLKSQELLTHISEDLNLCQNGCEDVHCLFLWFTLCLLLQMKQRNWSQKMPWSQTQKLKDSCCDVSVKHPLRCRRHRENLRLPSGSSWGAISFILQ